MENMEHQSPEGDGAEESSWPPHADESPWKVTANNPLYSCIYFNSLGISNQGSQTNLAPREGEEPVRG